MISEYIKGNKRQEGESYEEYKQRRQYEGDAVKRWLRGDGRYAWESGAKGTAIRVDENGV